MNTETKKLPRAEATAQKKEKIYRTALTLFREKGYGNVTMKEIAAESGLSEGSIFHFFGSKAGILSGFSAQMFQKAGGFLELTEENLQAPVRSVVQAMFCHGECFSEIGAELTSMYYNNLPEPYETIVNIRNPNEAVACLYKPLYEFVREACRRGTLRLTVTPEEFTTMLYTLCNGLVLVWTRSSGCFDLMELSRPQITLLVEKLTGEAQSPAGTL